MRTVGLSSEERGSIVVDVASLVSGVDANAGTSCRSLLSYKADVHGAQKQFSEALRGIEAALRTRPSDVAVAGYRVCIMAHSRVQLVFHENHSDAPASARAPRPRQDNLFGVQLGEAFIPATQCITALMRPNAALQFTIKTNESGQENALVNGSKLFVECLEVLGKFPAAADISLWHAAETLRMDGIRSGRIKAIDVCYIDIIRQYESAFCAFGETARATADQLSRIAIEGGQARSGYKMAPHLPQLTRFHVPSWVTYGITDGTLPTTRLPIWYYVSPRVNVDYHTDLKIHTCARVLDHAIAAYQFSTSDVAYVATLFEQYVPSSSFPNNEKPEPSPMYASTPVEQRRADLIAARDFIAQMLTMPAFAGKYRSDYRVGGINKDTLMPCESCEFHRLTGQGNCDDCEGSDCVTTQHYFLMVKLARTSDERVPRLMRAIGLFLDTQYEFISTSGSTASAFPGTNILSMTNSFVQTDLTSASNDVKTAAYNVLAASAYNSTVDWNGQFGFHQYSTCIPISVLYDMVTRSLENGYNSNAAGVSDACRDRVRAYYTEKYETATNAIADLEPGMPRVPPAILLESTYPVSTQLVGTSAFMFSGAVPGRVENLTIVQRQILAADRDACSIAGKFKELGFRYPEDGVKTKDMHSMRRQACHISDGNALVQFSQDRARYGSWFYRLVCHGINVSMIERLTDVLSSGSNNNNYNATCALAYMTFLNGRTARFGVPVEDLITSSMENGSPFKPAEAHAVAFPFARVPERTYNELDALVKQSNIMAHQPPILYGAFSRDPSVIYCKTMPDYVYVPGQADVAQWHSESKPRVQSQTIAQRILNTRILLVEPSGMANGKIGTILKEAVAVLGGPSRVSAPLQQKIKLFPVFGEEYTCFSMCQFT